MATAHRTVHADGSVCVVVTIPIPGDDPGAVTLDVTITGIPLPASTTAAAVAPQGETP